MKADEQLLLIEGKVQVAKQVRYYQDELFAGLYPGAPKRKDGEERYV